MKAHYKAYSAALVHALIVGFSFMFVKLALQSANPIDTLAHRFSLAFLGAALAVWLTRTKLNLTLKDFMLILPLAVLYPSLFFSLQAYGLVYTSSSEAGIIFATTPIVTMVFAVLFLREALTKVQTFFICLSVSGTVFIFLMKGFQVDMSQLRGTVLLFLSVVSSALYTVLARHLSQRYSILVLTFIMSLFGFLTFNTFSIVQHVWLGTMRDFFEPLTSWSFVFSIAYLGILSSLGTSYLANYSLSQIEAFKISVFQNFSTLISLFAGILILHEHLYYYHTIGAVIIIAGVIGTNYTGNRNEDKEGEASSHAAATCLEVEIPIPKNKKSHASD